MRYLSLFSGIEAASVAWAPLGWRAVAFAEVDPFCSALLAHHYPDVPNLGDVTAVDWTQYRKHASLLVGGPPCQAFSVAGLRQSLQDKRGNLSLEFARAIHAVDPVYAVVENVPGWLSTKDNAFGCFLAGLVGADAELVPARGQRWTDAGMVTGPLRTAAWRVLDAQYFGLAQRRRRVFVVSCRAGDRQRNPAALLFESARLRRHTPPRREKGQRVAASLTRGSATGSGVNEPGRRREDDVNLVVAHCLESHHPRSDYETETLVWQQHGSDVGEMGCLRAGRGDVQSGVPFALTGLSHYVDGSLPSLRAEGGDCAGGSEAVIAFDTTQVTSKANYSNPQFGDPCHPLAAEGHPPCIAFDWQASGSGDESFRGKGRAYTVRAGDYTGALQETKRDAIAYGISNQPTPKWGEDVAPSLDAKERGGGRMEAVQAGMVVRRLTPTEAERLMGVPDRYTSVPYRGKPATDSSRYRALGNSFAVPVMRWIGERIQMVENVIQEAD